MQNIGIDVLVGKVGSTYKMVILAARRAIELSEGAAKLVEARPDEKVINIALKEIAAGKISYKVKDEK